MTDAWEQLNAPGERYTKNYPRLPDGMIRPDMEVFADGLHRCVHIDGIQHNVKTVRAFVAVLEEACAFVEQANPVWAQLGSTAKVEVTHKDGTTTVYTVPRAPIVAPLTHMPHDD